MSSCEICAFQEDFYSDPALVSTLAGLEEDMYSLAGEPALLSPFPLLPALPSSQPVSRIYQERGSGGPGCNRVGRTDNT